MSWTADAASYTGASTDTWTDDTVDGVDTVADEVWVCTATPTMAMTTAARPPTA